MDFNYDVLNTMNYMDYAKTGVNTVIVAVVALAFGQFLEKTFIGKSDLFAVLQLFIVGISYDFMRDFYKPDPEAWVAFSSAMFVTQPTLFPRLKRLFNI